MRSLVNLLVLCLILPTCTFAQAERNLLTGKYSFDQLRKSLTTDEIKLQYPPYKDRSKWEALDPAYRCRLIADGDTALDYKWQTIPATVYLEFVRSGNRYIMEDIYNQNVSALRKLAFAELAEGKERYIPQIINGVWALCEVSSWSISASIGLQKAGPGLPDINEPVIELGAGITANAIAWIYYLFNETFDRYSQQISKRIRLEIERRILDPYSKRNDFWWMALDGKNRMVNNWNVWLNYNVLTCLLLVEKDEVKRANGIYKTMRSVDQFINYYKEDGACEEGPAYWSHAGGMLFNYLSLLKQSTLGTVNIFSDRLVKNIGSYICKAYIDSSWFLNYADASAKMVADAGLVYHFGKATNDSTLISFGSYLARQQDWTKMAPVETMYGGIRNLFSADSILRSDARQPFIDNAWMEGTGIVVARDGGGSSKGFYFSALAGHNAESHNHNDVGACVLFYNGHPILIDVGSGTYTGKTFGPDRYTIWTMRSAYHNVPLINGAEQQEGKQYAAGNAVFMTNSISSIFSLDITKAYPAIAEVKKWKRTYLLKRHESFTINDQYEFLSNKANTELHFMTCARVAGKKKGILQLTSEGVKVNLQYDPEMLDYSIEPIAITDKRLLQSWPPEIYRLVFKLRDNRSTKGNLDIVFKEGK